MPRGDGRGPLGSGAMTGRGAGFCGGFVTPGYSNPACGRGFGMGLGNRRGRRNMFYATGRPGFRGFGRVAAPGWEPESDPEKQALKNQADFLQAELERIRKRLGDIETSEE